MIAWKLNEIVLVALGGTIIIILIIIIIIMGCASSRVNEPPAVALCRQRCGYLQEAMGERYALSEAHLSYINSLQSLSLSLQRLQSIPHPQVYDNELYSSFYEADWLASQPPPMNIHQYSFNDGDDDDEELRRIRQEEGIPDLEEDVDEVAPVQWYGAGFAQAFLNQAMPMGHDDVELFETEVHVGSEMLGEEGGGLPDASFQVLFQRASECAMEMSPLLEPRALPYHPKHAPYYQGTYLFYYCNPLFSSPFSRSASSSLICAQHHNHFFHPIFHA